MNGKKSFLISTPLKIRIQAVISYLCGGLNIGIGSYGSSHDITDEKNVTKNKNGTVSL